MHWTLDRWLHLNRGMLDERNKYKKKASALEAKVRELQNQSGQIQNGQNVQNEEVRLKDWAKSFIRRMK